MNIYLVERTDGVGYDEYCGMVVIAKDDIIARSMNPSDNSTDRDAWVKIEDIHTLNVTLVGKALPYAKQSVILTDFNAG